MEKYYKKFAELVVGVGVNLQSGQPAVINCPIECANFARVLSEECYKKGASEVYVRYKDDALSRQNFLYQSLETLSSPHEFLANINNEYSRLGACFISIYAEDPDILAGIEPQKLQASEVANGKLLVPFRKRTMSSEVRWVVVSLPTKAWAKKVFPQLEEGEAMEKLGDMIAKSMYLDKPCPIEEWKNHTQKQEAMISMLERERFEYFHFQNSLGTDLMVGMMPEAIFTGAKEVAKDGVEFIANMPTEEIFSAPHRDRTNGIVYSSKPLSYQGNIIEEFWIEFQDGKATNCGAKQGEEMLKSLIKTDENSCRLGEIAFVEHTSGISSLNTIFYNTLFDENASCHLALGKGYPSCVEGDFSQAELEELGLNDSIIHEDFMIGTRDMKIVGVRKDGTKRVIMQDGEFLE